MGYARYGVYFTPPPGPLADFGAAWLGWDLAAGQPRPHPTAAPLPRPIADLTETPRKYGFHATLKAPFRLVDDLTEDALHTVCSTLASELAPVRLDGMNVERIGGFVALVAEGDLVSLNALASRLVKGLDYFRAPAPEEELARRRAKGLTAQQDALLNEWGYPYVLDEFRFHMTLSGKLAVAEAEAVEAALAPTFKQLIPEDVTIDGITLVGEGADGRFRQIERFELTGGRRGSTGGVQIIDV